MQCQFEGVFTEDEKRRIRTSLRALNKAAGAVGIEDGTRWRVGRVHDDASALTLFAVHVESEVEIWERSVDDLIDQIRRTTELLRSTR